jgi:hydroxyacylglutathione hydrolase
VPYDRPLLLVPADPAQIEEAVRALVRVGLDDIRGYLQGGLAAWKEAGFPLAETPQTAPRELHESLARNPSLRVLDIRGEAEWQSGHIEGAIHLFGGTLVDHLAEIPPTGAPLALVCASGYRSTVAASVLERAGFHDLRNLAGGMSAWQRAGLPVVSPASPARSTLTTDS